MPKKIRELKLMLSKAGFVCRAAKGSHTVWQHPSGNARVTLSGNDGADAKLYQERQVAAEIAKVRTR